MTAVCGMLAKPALVPWAVNATLDVCRGAIAPGTEYAEAYLEAVWTAAKAANQTIKKDAASKGTALHKLLEGSLKVCGEASGETTPLQEWLRSIGLEVREVERKVYSRRNRYSGTLDALGETGGGLFLLDWKTGKALYPEFRLQTAAYILAYEEEFPDKKIEGRYIVRIAEDGSVDPHFYPRSSYRLDSSAFRGLLAAHRRVKQIEKSL